MERVALVTGGARGIGLGISEALAREGYALAVCGTRSAEAAAPQLEAVRRHGGEILYVQADVSQTADRSRLLDAVRARFGALHVLVNNAGVAPRVRADLLEASEESFGRVMRINLQGPYFLTQAAARWMVEQRRADASFSGCIVNIGSVSAEVASISRGEYCVAKAGMGHQPVQKRGLARPQKPREYRDRNPHRLASLVASVLLPGSARAVDPAFSARLLCAIPTGQQGQGQTCAVSFPVSHPVRATRSF